MKPVLSDKNIHAVFVNYAHNQIKVYRDLGFLEGDLTNMVCLKDFPVKYHNDLHE